MTRTPPKLSRPSYHVWVATDPAREPDYFHVVVNHADQLRAELEAKKQGLGKPQDTPMHLTSLWLWSALVRTGDYGDKFAAFKDDCLAYEPDKDDETGEPVHAEPDPTGASTG